ncbi:carboxylating nicotinate-nucleotide diphosphorylase [Candidatus Peregrinibacteria bacterium]|nr:carboxylating nicotinate-nucleotide diphosphorylase [Candidatus Peregrinibacteria bacterium]
MFFMDAHTELRPTNKTYLKALRLYVWGAYQIDNTGYDVSTKAFLGAGRKKVRAQIRANDEGILAGIQEAQWLIKKLGLKIVRTRKDGTKIKAGQYVLEIEGAASQILGAERTLLNLLQRMSGVATKTKKLSIKMPKGIKLLATRKTLWGLLDKRAVTLGGGGTHRLHLADAILIKENHITLAVNLKKSLKRTFRRTRKVRFTEIEFESPEEVKGFLDIHEKLKKYLRKEDKVVVMLDNFTPGDIKKVVKPLAKAGFIVELSGGINEKNISRYNIVGVSAISSGSITTEAPNLDFSLQIVDK